MQIIERRSSTDADVAVIIREDGRGTYLSADLVYHKNKLDRGFNTIINVWGSWCEGCREEMPYFVDLYATENFTSGKIKLLGIDVEERSLESGPNFIKSHSMTWPHLLDIDDKSKFVFGIGVPVTWFLDENGDVIYKHIGAYQTKEALYQHVEKYFKVKL